MNADATVGSGVQNAAEDDQMQHTSGDRSARVLLAAYQAALTVASETRLDAILLRLVELARDVAEARYAALGVADESGRLLQFINTGIDPELVERIGPLPEGHGLLGLLIREGTPLLIPDITAHPHSVGFPPNHPPMKTLLGVPILLEGKAIGNLYLSERYDNRPFTQEDLAAVELLAAHAATAIQRAQLLDELERSRRVAETDRDRLQTIIDQLPAGVVIQMPPDGRVALANHAARRMIAGAEWNTDSAAPLPRVLFKRLDGSTLPLREWPHVIALSGPGIENYQQQLLLVTDDGRVSPVLVHASSVSMASDGGRGCVVVLQDMTRLREAEQLKDDFLSLVSHEFRTPLTAIHGGAHILETQRSDLDRETEQALLEDISRESARLDRMLGNMLRLAEVMAGRLQSMTEPVLVGPLVQRVIRDAQARTPHVWFSVEIPPDLPAVEGDPALLDQVLHNLCENAVKYSQGSPEIRITADVTDGLVAIHVIDRGIGIAPEHVSHVFERFRRPGTDLSIRGMGLGLYLCHQLMLAQGGQIQAKSEGVGKGSTFSLILPIAMGWADES